jgi:hypothetical protein
MFGLFGAGGLLFCRVRADWVVFFCGLVGENRVVRKIKNIFEN